LGVGESAIETSLEDTPDELGVAFVRDLLNPLEHSAGPFLNFGPLHKRQDKNDFLFGRFETRDVVIERQVFLYFVHKGVGVIDLTNEDSSSDDEEL